MPQVNNFPGGFAHGVTIRGMPLAVTHPGKVFWVSNSGVLSDRQIGSSNGNQGTFDAPFSTITGALSKVVADRGDIIMVKPGHAETISAAGGIVLNKAGVALVGLGKGAKRPTITWDTAITATMTVTANDVTVHNFLFKANFLNITAAIVIANAQVATDLTIDNCEFRDNSVILNFVRCITVGTTANIADGLTVSNNKYHAAACTTEPALRSFMAIAGHINRLTVVNNFVNYPKLLADTPWLLEGGASNMTSTLIQGNRGFRPNTSVTGGSMVGSSSTACSGLVADNYDAHLQAAAGIMIATGTKFGFFNNYSMVTGAADKSALINPVAV